LQSEALMGPIGQFASRILATVLLAAGYTSAAPQAVPLDGIDRNLLERQQREREFHVKLYDAPVVGVPGVAVSLPIPGSFTERESYDRAPASPPPNAATKQVAPDGAAQRQLDDSQQRRQLELQTQNKLLDDVTRQRQSQIQQLQFGRENQAQQLQQQIQRDSSGMMQRLH
jgi:hypothetical protein